MRSSGGGPLGTTDEPHGWSLALGEGFTRRVERALPEAPRFSTLTHMVKRDEEQRLIPTLIRAATSRGASYPLGAETLTNTLRDAPQFEKLNISFHAQPQVTPLDPACVVFAGIGCRSPDAWELWVSAIPSELSARARAFAIEHGLPHLLGWLSRPRPETWFLHWHRCAMAIDPITNEGMLAELEEQRLIEVSPAVPLRRPEGSAPGSRR
jgi:hypothetical protein